MEGGRRRSDERLAVVETKVDKLEAAVLGLGKAIADHANKAEEASDKILEAISDPDGELQRSISGVRKRHAKLERRVYWITAMITGAGLGGTKLGAWLLEQFKGG